MNARFPLYFFAAFLSIVGLSGALYKNLNLGFPLWPGESKNVWTLQSKIEFQPTGDPIEVTLALPEKTSNGVIIDENFSSSGFGFVIFEEGEQRYARWTRREAPSKNVISLNYTLQVVHDNSKLSEPNAPEGEVEKVRTFPSERDSLRLMLDRLSPESATDASFTHLMLGRLNARDKRRDVGSSFVGQQ